jgi:hypothetical protein
MAPQKYFIAVRGFSWVLTILKFLFQVLAYTAGLSFNIVILTGGFT